MKRNETLSSNGDCGWRGPLCITHFFSKLSATTGSPFVMTLIHSN
jgi:hypothetical protein